MTVPWKGKPNKPSPLIFFSSECFVGTTESKLEQPVCTEVWKCGSQSSALGCCSSDSHLVVEAQRLLSSGRWQKAPRPCLSLTSQSWDYKRTPPHPDFPMGSGDVIQVLVLTQEACYQLSHLQSTNLLPSAAILIFHGDGSFPFSICTYLRTKSFHFLVLCFAQMPC